MRKRIAILLSQMEEKTQKSIMEAFTKEAYAHDYDLCVFSAHQKYQDNALRNVGDFNIFSLVNFEKFDGILVLLDTIMFPGGAEYIQEKIHQNYDGPVIVVDKESRYFEHVMMNHQAPLEKLVDHMIEVHGCTDIAFLGGTEGHPHSVQRLNGYLDSMKKHGIDIREDRIFHGNYWFDSGYKIADYLNDNREDWPEAFVCANDYMAIGLAARLEEYGFKVPDDIAIVGYDSVDEGRLAPEPLTSAEIPAGQCGKVCFYKLHSAITGEPIKQLSLDTEIFIGGSCGCKHDRMTYIKKNRDEWKTDHSVASFYSDLNHITEDMICQTEYESFFNMLVRYSYQVRPFYKLWFCLNDGYDNPISFIGDKAIINGYADKMHTIIKYGEGIAPEEAVRFDREFDTKLMLPDLYEDRDYPTTFVFSPLFFEDRCFGYAVLNMGKEPCIYNKTYRVWIRNANQGIESFYRQKAMQQLFDRVKSEQIRDLETGLYNYKGFQQKLMNLTQENIGRGKNLGIISIDLADMKGINSVFGRKIGDEILLELSRFLSNNTYSDEVCGRMCNDEFLVGFLNADCEKRLQIFIDAVKERGMEFITSEGDTVKLSIHYAMRETELEELPDIDYLVNQAVNAKNYQKKILNQKAIAYAEMTKEEAEKCDRAEQILNDRSLSFHFQPIVSAKDGSVFGYEALMRDESESHLSPLDIISAAEILKRLYDIELQTINGVLDRIETDEEDFEGKKVFINSLPAFQLCGQDEAEAIVRLGKHRGNIVIEYTETSEVDDEKIYSNSNKFSALNIEVALDDYGSGYSNTNNLLRYSPNFVKLDRELIAGIDTNPHKEYFVKSIIEYSKTNNIVVLAEGVETKEELRTVINLGVDLIQGYYTGRPVSKPITQIEAEVKAQIIRYNIQKTQSRMLYRSE